MRRLIDADELSLKLRHMGYMDENEEVQEVIDLLSAPIVDAVEVVRCKDCKFAQNNRYNSRVDGKNSVLCEHVTTEDGRYELKVFRNANDFCNYGKRREE